MEQEKQKWHKIVRRRVILFLKEFLIEICLSLALLSFSFAVRAAFFSSDHDFDNDVFSFVKRHVTAHNTDFLFFITHLGNYTFLLPANILLLIYFLIRKNKRFSIRVLSLSLSSLCLMLVLKSSIQRTRPENPLLQAVNGYSFPSGHALMSVIFYGLLIYIAWHEIKNSWWRRGVIVLLALLILFIGFSRIYLRVHYASDVIAGLSVGFIWLIVSLWFINQIEARRAKRKLIPQIPPVKD
jgi:undecaprenyl-diphosphatase